MVVKKPEIKIKITVAMKKPMNFVKITNKKSKEQKKNKIKVRKKIKIEKK